MLSEYAFFWSKMVYNVIYNSNWSQMYEFFKHIYLQRAKAQQKLLIF